MTDEMILYLGWEKMGMNQVEISRRCNISKQAVNKSLKKAKELIINLE